MKAVEYLQRFVVQHVFDDFDAAVAQFLLPLRMNGAFVKAGDFFDLLAAGTDHDAPHSGPRNRAKAQHRAER